MTSRPRILHTPDDLPLRDYLNGAAPVTMRWDRFITELYLTRGFVHVIWNAPMNFDGASRLRKTGNPYNGNKVSKVQEAQVRNDFNFENCTRREVERAGGDVSMVEVGPRQWGLHLGGNNIRTPYVIHRLQADGRLRLYSHFWRKRKIINDYTGYYVDGAKIDDAELTPFEPNRAAPQGTVAEAKDKHKPLNIRMENVLYFTFTATDSLERTFYRITCPTLAEIEDIAATAAGVCGLAV